MAKRKNIPMRNLGGVRGGPPDQEKMQRSRRTGILRSLVILVGLIIVTLMVARRTNRPEIVDIAFTTDLTSEYEPVDRVTTFTPDTPAVNASVETRNYWPDMVVTARWLHTGQVIAETPFTDDAGGDGYIGFTLTNDSLPWAEGKYVLQIVFKSRVLREASFWIEE